MRLTAIAILLFVSVAAHAAQIYDPGVIVPTPKSVRPAKACSITDGMHISCSEAAADSGQYLSENLAAMLGIRLGTTPVVRNTGVLMWVDRTLKRPESYRLEMSGKLIKIRAADPDGCFHGVQTLLQILRSRHAVFDGRTISIPGAVIEDYPDTAWRGMMFQLPFSKPDLPTMRRMLEVMSRYKYNYAVLEFGPNVQSDSHPEVVRPRAITRQECRELVEYCKSLHIAPIPGVNSLGHGDRTLQFPDLVGDSLKGLDLSKESTYKTLFDVYSEVIEDFGHPKYFHAGMDEAWDAMKANIDKTGRSGDDLVVDHVIRMNGFFKSKGAKMIIWHDMLVSKDQIKDGPAFGASHGTWKALDRLPKDIVIDFWSYDPRPEYPTVAWLKRKGFGVIGSPWFSVGNIANMSRSACMVRAGVLGTLWNEPIRDHPSPQITPFGQTVYGQAICLTAEAAWNAAEVRADKIAYDPFTVFLKDYEERDGRLGKSTQVGLPAGASAGVKAKAARVLASCGRKPGIQRVGGVVFDIRPDRAVGWEGRAITEPTWQKMSAPLKIVLEDGRSQKIDGVNTERGESQVILYTPSFGPSTKTNRYGYEAVIVGGRVTDVRTHGDGDSIIPRNGFILSAHEAFAPNDQGCKFVGRLKIGQKVDIVDGSEKSVFTKSVLDPGVKPLTIPVNAKVTGLSLLHTLGLESPSGMEVGTYVFRYNDGKTESRPLVAGSDITTFDAPRFTFPRGKGTWVALAGGSKPARGTAVYALDWENPHPEKTLESVTFRPAAEGHASGFMLLAMSLLQ